jgi:hypothetical protein
MDEVGQWLVRGRHNAYTDFADCVAAEGTHFAGLEDAQAGLL